MLRKVLTLTAIVAVFAASNLQAEEIIYSNWVGGERGYWCDPCNWDPPIVPDNNDLLKFVVDINSIRAGVDEIVVGLERSRHLNQLDCYGEVELENWTSGWVVIALEDTNDLTNHGYLNIDELEINGDVNNTTKATLCLCDMGINGGNLYNHAEAIIEVVEDVYVDVNDGYGGFLENAGVLMVVPTSMLETQRTLHNTAQINVFGGACRAGEIFDNGTTGVIRGFGVLHAGQLVRNKGQIIAFGGSLAIKCEGPLTNTGTLGNKCVSSLYIKPAEDVNNQGSIEVNAGGGVAFDCNLVNIADANINLLGGSLAAKNITQQAGATFKGFGGITGNVIIDSSAIIKLTGPTNIVGDVEINPNATLEISDGLTLITGQTACNGTIHMKGGLIIPQGGLSGDCNIIWEPGIYTNVADFNLDGQVNFKDYAYFANTWLWQTAWY